jgi:hypothetical protein
VNPQPGSPEATVPTGATEHGGPDAMVELAYALPHVHEGGISITLIDAVTNVTLCHVSRDDGGVICACP